MDQVNEKESASFSVVVRDEVSGEAITPLTFKWTLTDSWGELINNKEDVTETPSSTTYVHLTPDETGINTTESQNQFVERRLLVTITYNSTLGMGRTKRKEHTFEIKNLRRVS